MYRFFILRVRVRSVVFAGGRWFVLVVRLVLLGLGVVFRGLGSSFLVFFFVL